jgi:hypothetical protein
MKSTLMLLAGATALVLTAASAEPPHGPKCPPGEPHCMSDGAGKGPQNGPQKPGQIPMSGPMKSGPTMSGPAMSGPMSGPQMKGSKPGPGPIFKGGPGWNKGPADWHWKDNRGGWHRDHDRYWRPEFRGFVSLDRLFFSLRQNRYTRFDGEPYWFRGHFVIRTFDRRGRPVIVELNPYTGDFIGIVRF